MSGEYRIVKMITEATDLGDAAEQCSEITRIQSMAHKHWRLIIRNLSFKETQESIKKVCEDFGPLMEIVLPKCKDPRFPDSCAGFAFVQFSRRKDAERAMEALNLTEIGDRKVAVDWAIQKDTYDTIVHEEKLKAKSIQNEFITKETKKEDATSSDDDRDSLDLDLDETNETSENDESRLISKFVKEKSRNNVKDAAIEEQRVVFIRNLSFDVSDDDLRNAMDKFGVVKTAVVCHYEGSGHAKGSGFVHFATKEEADSCIAAFEEKNGIDIRGRRAFGCRAIAKSDLMAKERDQLEKKPKDKRNLHLLRVGIIRAGTLAANGMSENDGKKRSKLVATAGMKVRNLQMFVSSNRLVLHNLPLSLTDKKLRSICFLAAGNPDAVITECRIWRDMSKLNDKGIGQSRGFAFVAFSEHSDALAALKCLNNNPETFSNDKRPIVEFSIENMWALRLREKRQQKCQAGRSDTSEKSKLDLERTKQQLAASGQKPLPSHTGPKLRHRDLAKKRAKRQPLTRKSVKTMPHKRVNSQMNGGSLERKKRKLGNPKQITKYLALAL